MTSLRKHRKNCESCQSQVTWKVKSKCQFSHVLSYPVLSTMTTMFTTTTMTNISTMVTMITMTMATVMTMATIRKLEVMRGS